MTSKQSTREDIDTILVGMVDVDAKTRPTAAQALEQLVELVSSIPPKTLLVPPIVYDLQSAVQKEINAEGSS